MRLLLNANEIPAATVRRWAWSDAGMVGNLLFPPLVPKFIAGLYWIGGKLGYLGIPPALEPFHLWFISLAGALWTMWVVARLRHPVSLLGLIDGWGRSWIAAMTLYAILVMQAPHVLWVFFLATASGGVAQLWLAYRPASLSRQPAANRQT